MSWGTAAIDSLFTTFNPQQFFLHKYCIIHTRKYVGCYMFPFPQSAAVRSFDLSSS